MTPTSPTPITYGHDASLARFSVARYQKMIIKTDVATPSTGSTNQPSTPLSP